MSVRLSNDPVISYKATSAAADMTLNRALEDTDADTEKAPGLKDKRLAEKHIHMIF